MSNFDISGFNYQDINKIIGLLPTISGYIFNLNNNNNLFNNILNHVPMFTISGITYVYNGNYYTISGYTFDYNYYPPIITPGGNIASTISNYIYYIPPTLPDIGMITIYDDVSI